MLLRIGAQRRLLLLVFALAACRKEEAQPHRETPPPTAPSPAADICADGAATVFREAELNDTFVTEVGGLCIDPNGEARAYGEGEAEPIEAACTQLFNAECELYKAFGLRRVASVRYVDRRGVPAAVTANLSRFSGSEGAYAFYTHRVLAGSDPKTAPLEPLAIGGGAVLGGAFAYVWKANQVLELRYSNENEAPAQLRVSSGELLPVLAATLGQRLRGDMELPESARRLPEEHRLPLGLVYETRDAFQVPGLGSGATGHYEHNSKRYRIFLSVNPDEHLAKDMIRSLRRLPGLRTLKEVPYDAFELRGSMLPGSPVTHWLVGRNEQVVAAIGDEAFALHAGLNAEQKLALCLDKDQKMAQLRRVLR
jgi:hypothetical protein